MVRGGNEGYYCEGDQASPICYFATCPIRYHDIVVHVDVVVSSCPASQAHEVFTEFSRLQVELHQDFFSDTVSDIEIISEGASDLVFPKIFIL